MARNISRPYSSVHHLVTRIRCKYNTDFSEFCGSHVLISIAVNDDSNPNPYDFHNISIVYSVKPLMPVAIQSTAYIQTEDTHCSTSHLVLESAD